MACTRAAEGFSPTLPDAADGSDASDAGGYGAPALAVGAAARREGERGAGATRGGDESSAAAREGAATARNADDAARVVMAVQPAQELPGVSSGAAHPPHPATALTGLDLDSYDDDDDGENDCPICREVLHAPAVTPCGHTFCDHCIRRYLELVRWDGGRRPCPMCRAPVSAAQLAADEALAALIVATYGSDAHAARAECVHAEQQAWEAARVQRAAAAGEQRRWTASAADWHGDEDGDSDYNEPPRVSDSDDDDEDNWPDPEEMVRRRYDHVAPSPFAELEAELARMQSSFAHNRWRQPTRAATEWTGSASRQVTVTQRTGGASEAARARALLRQLMGVSRRREPEWADAAAHSRRRR